MAAETGTPDDHDLYSFEVFEVNPPARKGVSWDIPFVTLLRDLE